MRTGASDGQPQYRVVVERFKRIKNPAYVPGRPDLERYYLLTEEVAVSHYGPYPKPGTAKGILTRETVDADGGLRWGVKGGWLEKAEIEWKKVQL